jgi:uncharacterized zinc-type alcohol dehydrogenase-like protein
MQRRWVASVHPARLHPTAPPFLQVGIPGGGATMSVPLQDLVFGQKRVAGSIVGGRADMQEMLDFAGVAGVRPVLEIMPLSEVRVRVR